MGNTTRHPPEAARIRATPPARRHRARATQQATTQTEEAQAGSTEQRSASAQQPPPKHKAHNNTRQHTPQPRTHQHRATHNQHTMARQKKQKKRGRRKKNKQTKTRREKKSKKQPREGERKKREKKQERAGRQSAKAQGTQGTKTKKQETRGAQIEKTQEQPQTGQPQPGGGLLSGSPTRIAGSHRAKKKARRGPSRQRVHQERPEEKVRRTKARPGGRPARPGQESTHTHTRRGPGRKGRCRRPHETAPVHRPSPPSTDGGYGKPDALATGSTHAKHRSASSPRPTPEGPARDNPIAGFRTGTTRSEPSAPASAGASGRHNEPSSQLASACPAQPPSKDRGDSPRAGERHHSVQKADWSTESDRTGRGEAHHAGPRGTQEGHDAGHNHSTRTGAIQQRPPGAANPDSGHHDHMTTAREAVPNNTQPGRDRPPERTHAAQEAPGASGKAQRRGPGRGGGATAKRRRGQAAPERPDAPDWIVRGGPRSRSRRAPDRIIQGPVAVDAQDWIIRGGTSSRSQGEHEKRPRGQGRGEAAKWSGGRGREEPEKPR